MTPSATRACGATWRSSQCRGSGSSPKISASAWPAGCAWSPHPAGQRPRGGARAGERYADDLARQGIPWTDDVTPLTDAERAELRALGLR